MNPFITAVVVIGIVMTSAYISLNAANFLIQEDTSMQAYNEAKHTMTNIQSIISEILFETTGARRSINIDINGKFMVDGNSDELSYKINNFMLEEGTILEEDGINVISGPTMNAYEKDIDNDGTDDLILENEFVLFAIEKISTNLNTSNMITMMRNKEEDVNVIPTSGILINDMPDTSYGTGSTILTVKGRHIQSSSIKVSMNSDAGIDYNATFTLGAGNDFIQMEVTM